MSAATLRHILLLAGTLVGAGLVGWFWGHPAAGIAIVSGLWLTWHLLQNLRLQRWLGNPRSGPPQSIGLWRAVFERLFRMQRQTNKEITTLKIALEEFRTATDAFPEPVLLIDNNHMLLWYNDSAVGQLNLRRKSDRGHLVKNLIRQPKFIEWLEHRNEATVEIESPIDANIIFQVTTSNMESGRQLLIFRDISELHAVENMRRDFVANVSHELRTPLTVLVGYLEALSDESNPELAMIMERMRGQTQLMQSLIEDLIEISRLQSRHMTEREERVAMSALLMQLRKQAESLSDGRHKFLFKVATDMDLFGASKDLESAFTNLITNAVRYTPEGGAIELLWQVSSRGGELSVMDTGIGIPAKDIPRLTERFYRVAKDRSRASGGSGLGLSIVKHVLNAHNATLEIESQAGEGSTFRCVFPPDRLLENQPGPQTINKNGS